jgi:hypothetical protein
MHKTAYQTTPMYRTRDVHARPSLVLLASTKSIDMSWLVGHTRAHADDISSIISSHLCVRRWSKLTEKKMVCMQNATQASFLQLRSGVCKPHLDHGPHNSEYLFFLKRGWSWFFFLFLQVGLGHSQSGLYPWSLHLEDSVRRNYILQCWFSTAESA